MNIFGNTALFVAVVTVFLAGGGHSMAAFGKTGKNDSEVEKPYRILKPASESSDGPIRPSASRIAPPKIAPVVHAGVSYEAPWDPRGTLIAKDKKTGKELWRLLIVDDYIDPILERDVQETWFAKMEISKDGKTMHVTDEVGRLYVVDLEKRTFTIPKWNVSTKIVEWRPTETGWKYWVELRIYNRLNRPILLDRDSVAATRELTNNLFVVSVDGKSVSYRGMMKKRAPPDPSEFIRLGPGETYIREIEIGENYPVPSGEHEVTVGFEHTNHFSPDGFRMTTSRPDSRGFSGEGYDIRENKKVKD